mgnify:CR=1 FL=1
MEDCLVDETGLKRIATGREYILSNWTAAKLRLRHQNRVKGSSTEGACESCIIQQNEFKTNGLEYYRRNKNGKNLEHMSSMEEIC